MVPVELRLNNFMSYGASVPSLDFGTFHVACLSGRNGQGKSALLDAITWALWGEARKSSGSHKPDDELLRIGTREMEVELVFDLEGDRYRVVRSYARSATGRTSRPGLEFQVYEPDRDGYRPLTGASIRETQEILDRTLGIDYDTFINSAFLLQGRSDEFTKKRPSERKEILARILNLSRYERLAERAREREQSARERLELAEHEIERLRQVIADEPTWKEEQTRVASDITAARERLEQLRADEQRLVETLAGLEARAREMAGMQDVLEGLAARRQRFDQDAAALRRRIEEAETLMARGDAIMRDYERYEALQREREQLDVKRDLHRGVEMQVQQRESELKDRRMELEKRAHALGVELRSCRSARDECEARLKELPALERRLEAVRAARARMEELGAVRERRQALEEEITRIERDLLGQRESLQAQLAALDEQIARDEKTVAQREGLEQRRETLRAACRRREQLEEEIESVRKEGQELAEALREREGMLAALRQEREAMRQSFEEIHELDAATCPTCGTALTPEHRLEVETRHRKAEAALAKRIEEADAWIVRQNARRDDLRARYRSLERQIGEHAGAAEQLATVEEQLRAVGEVAASLEDRRTRAATLRRQLDEKSYGEELRRLRLDRKQALDGLPFDEAAFEQLRNEAAQLGPLEARHRELEQLAGRKDQLEKTVASLEHQEAEARSRLEDGSAFRAIHEQIERLRAQLEQIGFDPGRFDEVRQSLRALSQAGARMKDLLHAQQNHADWKTQLEAIEQQIEALEGERRALVEKIDAAAAELRCKPELETQRQARAAERKAAEDGLHGLQQRLGELTAKLDQAQRDRRALKETREIHAHAKTERSLFRQLRTAFGRHGIPSLIIESTLPEIEERANVLLDRLSDGRMHVRLETLKDKKSGGTKETLEIIITDEQGVPRAYETFSGGEAFRVNFALRIALAQLLAERSGVRIRTLVIDEGFGTQDTQGVQSMVEAIQAIQDDFDKIVVITHLNELKEAFPVRIEVEKDPVEGSRFEVLGI